MLNVEFNAECLMLNVKFNVECLLIGYFLLS